MDCGWMIYIDSGPWFYPYRNFVANMTQGVGTLDDKIGFEMPAKFQSD